MLQPDFSGLNLWITGIALLVLFTAVIRIRAESRGKRKTVYIFKPLGMVFILVMAVALGPLESFYQRMILTGLVISVAGDVFLMLPKDRFIHGLVAFLIAHLFYISGFISVLDRVSVWPFLIPGLFGFSVFLYLSPCLGKRKLPVLFYVLVIVVMAGLAWGVWLEKGGKGALMAAVGSVLFIISDSVLAIMRFRGKFVFSTTLKVLTYLAAQFLIASSMGPF